MLLLLTGWSLYTSRLLPSNTELTPYKCFQR